MNGSAGFLRTTRVLLLACGVTTGFCTVAAGQPGKHEDPLSWDRSVGGLVQRYCTSCHNRAEARGGIDLARDQNPRLILQHRDTWETALEMVEGEAMPPDDARQPSDKERALLVEFLRLTLADTGDPDANDPGPPTLRRLNRVEYDNAIADLTGLDLHVAESFPPDPSGYGFDNIGDALTLSPVQIEGYYDAARTIVRQLLDSKATATNAYERVFGRQPDRETGERQAARAVIERFASRAFRRPVQRPQVDRLMSIYDRARSQGQPHDEATGHMLTAVLISPQFLLRVEQNQPEADKPFLVDDYELATRLSFFLWSRPPDDTLLQLAGKGQLSDPETLISQTRRMLADPRSQALVDNFFGQWLGLQELDSHQPDPTQFPGFDDALRDAIRRETQMVLMELVQEDRPVTDLIDADFTYVNQRLGAFYGIGGVSGDEMQRVALSDRRRGGLLTSAALLMLQSDPTRTNVPRRGNFIAGRILGDPPPPPPPGVPMLEDVADDGQPRTVRELLELHRSKPECANCHAKIDPLGLSLENYDAIGRWREKEAGKKIDASAELADGRAFVGPAELKEVLLERREAFLRTFTKNLLIYALGRGPQPSDEHVIRETLKIAEAEECRFSSIVLAIVQSVPFRYRPKPGVLELLTKPGLAPDVLPFGRAIGDTRGCLSRFC